MAKPVREVVRSFVADTLGVELADDGDETNLFGAGLSSLQGVELVVKLEDEFEVVVPDALLTRERICSISALTALFEQVLIR